MPEPRFRFAETILLSLSTAVLVFALVRVTVDRPTSVRDWDVLDSALVGQAARGFAVATVDGDTAYLPRSDRATLVISHRTTCEFCERSLAAWQRTAERACGLDIVIISAEPLLVVGEYWKDNQISGCANVILGTAVDAVTFASDYQVQGTPRHYLIDRAQTLQSVWYGAVEGRLATRRFVRRAKAASHGLDGFSLLQIR
jgi:hypothetical protein